MNLLVRGAGSIGLRHTRNAVALGHTVYISDPNPDAVRAAAQLGALRVGPRIAFDAVIDATPPSQRSPGISPTLFEKPIAETAAAARQVARNADSRSMVGYQLRFVPGLNQLKSQIATEKVSYARIRFSQHLKDWRPGDWRNGISSRLGILLEASHELDLLQWLLGPWSWVQGWTSNTLGLPAEDVAVALVGLDGGIVEVHLDMVREGYERSIEVMGNKTHIVDLSYLHTGTDSERNQPYVDELAAFIAGIDGRRDPRAATLNDGVLAVELVDAIRSGEKVYAPEVEGSLYPYNLWR